MSRFQLEMSQEGEDDDLVFIDDDEIEDVEDIDDFEYEEPEDVR